MVFIEYALISNLLFKEGLNFFCLGNQDVKQPENNIKVEQKPEEVPKEEKPSEEGGKPEEMPKQEKPAEEKPEELPKQEQPEEGGGKPNSEDEIVTVPLENRNMTADDLIHNENDIVDAKLMKLTVNETEEGAYKLGPKAQESELIFAFEKEHGENRSSMFGGDILLSADIFEELSNYMQGQTEAPSPLEIKVLFKILTYLKNKIAFWEPFLPLGAGTG